ncbi:hypothetical protein ACQP2E_06150 [Actinoplanes sp. CA-015351]|uniref:hypothetical protein n=1 Tax=Actinoplanes sp. CA-015351 TaxID=3239897 RepID=UPI003D9938CB
MGSGTLTDIRPQDSVLTIAGHDGGAGIDLLVTAMLPAMSIDAERTALRLGQFEHRTKEAELQVEKLKVEITRLEGQVQLLRDKERATVQVARFSLFQRIVEIIGGALLIYISTFPLRIVTELAGNFAEGKSSSASSFRIVLMFAVVLGVSTVVLLIQSRLRKRKIKTQRLRMNGLEKEIEAKSSPSPTAGT